MSEIVERFDRIRRDAPDKPLIHLPLSKTTLTAPHLWDSAVTQRACLESAGIGPDHLLLYAAGNRAELFAFWLACRSLGTAMMPVDAAATMPEIAALATRYGASHAILTETGEAACSLGHALPFVPVLALVRLRDVEPAPQLYRGAAVLRLTSGSTGLPKATYTTESQLLHDSEHITTAMGIEPGDTQMSAIPLSHAYGIGNLLVPLLTRGTAIVLRETFVPHQFAADARAYGARVFPGVPFMFEHFKDHLSPGAWPTGLVNLISAGARLEASTAGAFHRSFGVKIHSFYGTTETGGIAFDDSADPATEGSVGRVMPGVTVTLLPEDGAPAGSGRVHVAGNAVSCGYVGEERRDGAFTEDGFLTGDFGKFIDRGHLVLTGRLSAFINVAGLKVQPEEVEAVLRDMPGVIDVRVLGAVDAARGEQIVACLVAAGEPVTLVTVRQHCATRLAPYKIPRTIVHLDRIPLTDRGKTDRVRLKEIVEQRLRGVEDAGVL